MPIINMQKYSNLLTSGVVLKGFISDKWTYIITCKVIYLPTTATERYEDMSNHYNVYVFSYLHVHNKLHCINVALLLYYL
jgi:hypothetical protein